MHESSVETRLVSGATSWAALQRELLRWERVTGRALSVALDRHVGDAFERLRWMDNRQGEVPIGLGQLHRFSLG